MVRYEDSPGVEKHLRFGNFSQELYDVLVGFPGIKCVVLHTHGAKGEHPHIHVWYEADKPITNQTVRNRLKVYNDLFKQCKSQNDWSFRNHNSWETWKTYVCNNPSHKVLLDYQDIKAHSERQSLVVATPQTPESLRAPLPIVRKEKVRSMREKFIKYLHEDLGWEFGTQFSIIDQQTSYFEIMENQVIDAATDFWEAAFTVPEGVRMVKYALYKFSCEETREIIRQKNRTAIKKSLW